MALDHVSLAMTIVEFFSILLKLGKDGAGKAQAFRIKKTLTPGMFSAANIALALTRTKITLHANSQFCKLPNDKTTV
jgi:hypothetical protein